MKSKLEKIHKEALKALKDAKDSDTLEKLERQFLGRKAELARIAKDIKNIAKEQRPVIGKLINDVKRDISAIIQEKKQGKEFLAKGRPPSGWDYTLPAIAPNVGHLHPITQFLETIEDIFIKMGYEVVEGPELESQKYNFDLLNVPEDHPSRDIQDTFYVDKKDARNNSYVLRTHTSPVQIRAMKTRKPPVRLIAPGRVYRNERTDAGHETNFYQCEGLVIDRNIRITDLIGTLELFIKRLYGDNVNIRVRPHFYPFTEPSIDIDMSCLLCAGEGCPFCKRSGWIETLGAGMVHPNVLKNMKVDPKEYSGFAFGLGIDRFMMLYYQVNDIRLSYSGDLRFIEQF
ncbi:phenylalanine--tRNA ligase subunit alpha [Patescibacteria group bacterium]|nr:phenylalanine--tRNA ligase subunit alpha [Patescibacteria group bacterium]